MGWVVRFGAVGPPTTVELARARRGAPPADESDVFMDSMMSRAEASERSWSESVDNSAAVKNFVTPESEFDSEGV
jgi:hypothetical protein